jgi:hypothetical protein
MIWSRRVWVEVEIRRGAGRLAAVVAAFARGLPGDRGKGALEEGVVDDVALVIFSFDDPVAGIGFALSGVGENEGGAKALRGVDEKGPAGAKRVHETLLAALFRRQRYFSISCIRKA